jgi:hypothetical protein
VALRFESACGPFDVRIVAEDGIEYLDEEIELCDGSGRVTVRDRGLAWTEARQP